MTLRFSPYTNDMQTVHRPVDVTPADVQSPATASFYHSYTKRALDVALIVLALPLVLPLVAIAAALIALDGRNPFYSQLRVGRNGQYFRMWKLRTMVYNADALLEDYLARTPKARAEWDATQKLKKDPRVTFIGRFLRKSSMDELPQLWNVFNGTMSLVGPRPMMVHQQSGYSGQSYYRLRPGITGLWQVSDRNDCDFADRVYYDDTYAREVSLRTDVQTLAQTVTVVLKATGH